jgi:hypothetical protein
MISRPDGHGRNPGQVPSDIEAAPRYVPDIAASKSFSSVWLHSLYNGGGSRLNDMLTRLI